jgi:hypothetical protein
MSPNTPLLIHGVSNVEPDVETNFASKEIKRIIVLEKIHPH